MNCPYCNTNNKHKVIAYGLPMSLCTRCGTVTGFFTFFYLLLSIPERLFDEGIDDTYFMGYEGSYWKNLETYIKDITSGRTTKESGEPGGPASGTREDN